MRPGPKISITKIERALARVESLDKALAGLGLEAMPGMAALYGELLAWRELKRRFSKRGYDVEFRGRQSKADVVLHKGGKSIKIEVKSSRYKINETWGTGYSYAMGAKRCRIHPKRQHGPGGMGRDFCYFDYLLAVLLSRDLKHREFYVFPRKIIEGHEKEFRNKSPRFKASSHRMLFIDVPTRSKEVSKFDRWLMKNKSKFRNNWKLIK